MFISGIRKHEHGEYELLICFRSVERSLDDPMNMPIGWDFEHPATVLGFVSWKGDGTLNQPVKWVQTILKGMIADPANLVQERIQVELPEGAEFLSVSYGASGLITPPMRLPQEVGDEVGILDPVWDYETNAPIKRGDDAKAQGPVEKRIPKE